MLQQIWNFFVMYTFWELTDDSTTDVFHRYENYVFFQLLLPKFVQFSPEVSATVNPVA